jgi:2-iminobutanoate/2-iminopropanoate deaminase
MARMDQVADVDCTATTTGAESVSCKLHHDRRTVVVGTALALLMCGSREMASAQSSVTKGHHVQLRAINPPGALIPGISQGIVVESGKLLFLSGHVPVLSDGSIAGPGLEVQLERVFENLKATLLAAGSTPGHVVRLTIYVRDYRPEMLPVIRSVRDRFVEPARPPASALIGVAALFHPDVSVEVDAIAVIPD